MCPPIETSRDSSSESVRVIDLRPERSALLDAWWVALHGVAAAALLALGLGPALALAALAAAAAHCVWKWPRTAPRLLYRSDGRVDAPEVGVVGATVGEGSRCTAFWIRLELESASASLGVLLLVDQLDPAVWRTLQAELRRSAADF